MKIPSNQVIGLTSRMLKGGNPTFQSGNMDWNGIEDSSYDEYLYPEYDKYSIEWLYNDYMYNDGPNLW